MSSGKLRPSCLGLNVLTVLFNNIDHFVRRCDSINKSSAGAQFNIKMSYHYRKCQFKSQTTIKSSVPVVKPYVEKMSFYIESSLDFHLIHLQNFFLENVFRVYLLDNGLVRNIACISFPCMLHWYRISKWISVGCTMCKYFLKISQNTIITHLRSVLHDSVFSHQFILLYQWLFYLKLWRTEIFNGMSNHSSLLQLCWDILSSWQIWKLHVPVFWESKYCV